MDQTNRQPLILILLKIPVTILLYFYQYAGTALFAPTYLYFLLLKPFVFGKKFEESDIYYAILTIPRGLLVLGGFVLAILQGGYLYAFIVEQTHQEGLILQYVTLFSTLFCLSFLFRRGYKQLFEVWKCPQLKSVYEHIEIIIFTLLDIAAIIFTLIVFCLIIRIRTVIKYTQKKKNIDKNIKRPYLYFIWKMTYYSLFEVIGLLGYTILHIFRWRLQLTKQKMSQAKYKVYEINIIYQQLLHTLVEILFSPLLLIMMISSFQRRQVLLQIKLYPIELIKRIVFDNLIEFIPNQIFFFLFVLSCVILPYKIGLIFQMISYSGILSERIKLDLQKQTEYSLKSYLDLAPKYSHYKHYERQVHVRILISTIIDIIALICIIPQAVTVYYINKLLKTIKEKKISINYINDLKIGIIETKNQISSNKPFEPKLNNYNLHKQIIIGFAKMLYDVPFHIMGLLSMIIAPWRIYDYRSNEYQKLEYLTKRHTAALFFFNSILDWIAILLFLLVSLFTYPFRYSYFNKTIKAIFRKDVENAIIPDSDSQSYNNIYLFSNVQSFILDYIALSIFDILYSPIFLITFIPIYTIGIYKNFLKIQKIQDYQVTKSRRTIFSTLFVLLSDLLNTFLIIFVYLTFYRKGQYSKFQELDNQGYYDQIQKQLTNKYSQQKGKEQKNDKFIEEKIKVIMILKKKQRKSSLLIQILYFIILDLVSFIPRAVILLTYIKEKKYHRILSERRELLLKDNQENVKINTEYEEFKFQLKFKIVLKLLVQLIVALFCLAFCLICTWRAPFIYMIFTNQVFKAQIIQKGKLTNPINIAKIFLFSFITFVLDLLCLPLLLLSIVLSPALVFNYLKNISYRYDSTAKETLWQQVMIHKTILVQYVFYQSLRDLMLTIKIIFVMLTLIRLPFLIILTRKNQISFNDIFIEYYSLVKPKSHSINKQKESLLERKNTNKGQNPQPNSIMETFLKNNLIIKQKLSFRKCVNISFSELIKDIPIFILSLAVMIVCPWRIYSIISLWKKTLLRIPLIEDEFGKVRLNNIRFDLLLLYSLIFIYDIPCMLMNILLILSIYKIPVVIRLFVHLLRKTCRKRNTDAAEILEQFDYRKQLKKQVKILFQEIQTFFQYIIIHILYIRVSSLKRRLNRFDKKKETNEKLRLYSLMNPIPLEDRPTRACMQTVSYNVYSKIAEFLDAKDLAVMQTMNRKLYIFTKQELIWEHLFNYKYSRFNITFYSDTFKLKCVEGYKHQKTLEKGKSISEEQMDDIIGRNHIIFDEYLSSVFDYPMFILNQFSRLQVLFQDIPSSDEAYQIIKNQYNKPYYIHIVSKEINNITTAQLIPSVTTEIDQSMRFFYKLTYFFLNKFESYIYIISYLTYKINSLVNAGETKHYQLLHLNRENVIDFQVLPQPFSYAKSVIYSLIQQLAFVVKFIYYQTLLFGLFEYKYFYGNGSFFESVFYPNPFVVFFIQLANGFLITHHIKFYNKIFYFINPTYIYAVILRFMIKTGKYVGKIAKQIFKKATEPLYDAMIALLKQIKKIKSVFQFIFKTIRYVFKKIFNFIQLIRKMIRGSKNGYYNLLVKAFHLFRKFNLIGDLFFTLFTILWMFWPFQIAFYFNLTSLWISATAVSGVLMVKGYLLIKKISNNK